jgi:hypothetical protein
MDVINIFIVNIRSETTECYIIMYIYTDTQDTQIHTIFKEANEGEWAKQEVLKKKCVSRNDLCTRYT